MTEPAPPPVPDDARDGGPAAHVAPPLRPGEQRHEQPVNARTVVLGLALTLGLHLAFGVGMAVLSGAAAAFDSGASESAMFVMFLIGAVQLVYMVPAWIVCRRRGLRGVALGLVIGASITFLLNSACFGIVLFSLGNLH